MINGKKLKFLIVDNDKEFVHYIAEYFSGFNTSSIYAFDLRTAIKLAKMLIFDFVLIDPNLPDGNALRLVEKFREANLKVGIIIISGKSSVTEKITGLNSGADAYLEKPISLEELSARIRNLSLAKTRANNKIIIFHEIILHIDDHRVFVNNIELKLTMTEFNLLHFLLSNPKTILTRETIGKHLYKNKYYIEDSFDFIYGHIKNLKKKIAQYSHKDYFKAVYRKGYKISSE